MSRTRFTFSFCVLYLSLIRGASFGDETKRFHKLLEADWNAQMEEDPIFATKTGDFRFNDRLPDVSLDSQKRQLRRRQKLMRKIELLRRDELSAVDQINLDVFTQTLKNAIAEYEFKSYLIPITNRSGFFVSFPELRRSVPLKTKQDYLDYIKRLAAYRKYTQQHIELMREGIKKDHVLPAVVLEGIADAIKPHIVDDPRRSLLYEPFKNFPARIDSETRKLLIKKGRQAISQSVVPGYRDFLTFMKKEYLPAARGSIAAATLPNGRAFYRYRVKKFTTLDLTPAQVHQTGLAEVKRIRQEMQAIIKKVGFKGGMPAFLKDLRTNPRFYAKTPEELLKETAFVLKKMDGKLPKLFKRLPRAPYGIRKVPAYIAPKTTTAYYMLPSGDGQTAGFYYVNTYNLKSRPLYGIEALSLHEAVPGHHLQLALQLELEGLPAFRKHTNFTAYIEGWALYSERLGLEVGFYQDPYSDFGRLTYEMWRACRLVVDTGMHYYGWSRRRAINYMVENTALSIHNITSEVDRYISWPGQALGYKIGELKIRQLRKLAENELGEKFDIREFHDVVLRSGSIPLTILENNVKLYINATIKESSKTTAMKQPTLGKYPRSKMGDQTDNYHGVKVDDPYRWLEDPDSEETKAWVKAQNKLTFGYLKNMPQRESIRRQLTKLWNYEKYGLPTKKGDLYFYSKNNGLQNQSVLYVANSLKAKPHVLLDPNKWSKDGTMSLAGSVVSDDGKLIAYAIANGGSDWREWKVRNIATGKDLKDHLRWIKFSSVAWSPDGSGFYYSRYDEPKGKNKLTAANYYQKLYYHKIGTDQAEDKLIYQRKDKKKWGFGASVSDDGQYLIIEVWQGTEKKNGVFYKDLNDPQAEVVQLLDQFDAQYEFMGNDSTKFWFYTNHQSPRNSVVTIDIEKPQRKNWHTIIPETKDTLRSASLFGEKLILSYLSDAHSKVSIHNLQGKKLNELKLDGIGTVSGFGGKRQSSKTFYSFTSFTQPPTIYRYDLKTSKSTIFKQAKVDFDPSDFVTKQIFYKSKDSTRVPMFIMHKKGIKLDGTNPTILYGYGGFDIAILPRFSISKLIWMQRGGVYVVANIRGGGEYGQQWHEDGTKLKKQNVFDDFIAAAEWLIDNKYTCSKRLAIKGGSNGGLLVGACMTQRPDLFAVALPAVGVMDMLRFHKFTIGWAWVSDFGSSENAKQFKAIYKYSPLHNIKPKTHYPATFITTADHDDRVVPAHSFKFAATLQKSHVGKNPILIRIETRAGHGAGTPTSKLIEQVADELSFTLYELGVTK